MSDNIRLTRDAERLALAMVRHYKIRVRQGKSKADAQCFGGPDQVSCFAPGCSLPDVADLVWELEGAGFASVLPGDNLFSECALMPSCIAWAENRLSDAVKGAVDVLSDLL